MCRSFRRVLGLVVAASMIVTLVPGMVFGAEVPECDYGDAPLPEVTAQKVWGMDSYESDDTSATAKTLPSVSYHTFHNIVGEVNGAGAPAFGAVDQDWFKFSVTATGTPVYIETVNDLELGQMFDPAITVYDEKSFEMSTLAMSYNDDKGFPTTDAGLLFIAPAPGTYWARVAPDDPEGVGSYWLYWGVGLGRRVAGTSRYKTAVEVSRLMFSSADNPMSHIYRSFPDYAVVASGESFADGLTGGVLASFCDAPLLLTDPDTLNSETFDEITRLFRAKFYGSEVMTGDVSDQAAVLPGGGTVFVMGGTAAISDAVVTAIESNPYVGSVVRVGGANRYETAALAMTHSDHCYGLGETAFVVNGAAAPDALAVAPVAAWTNSPVLLTGKSSVPAPTTDAIAYMGINRIVVVGGDAVVDSSGYAALASLVPTGAIERVYGDNRYQTAREVATFGIEEMGMPFGGLILCSGESMADALSAGPLCGWNDHMDSRGYALLLTPSGTLSPEVKGFMDDYPPIGLINYGVGGTSAISASTLSEFLAYGWPYDVLPPVPFPMPMP
jgi:putative cell wall-binding protein